MGLVSSSALCEPPLSHKKEGNPVIGDSGDGPGDHVFSEVGQARKDRWLHSSVDSNTSLVGTGSGTVATIAGGGKQGPFRGFGHQY